MHNEGGILTNLQADFFLFSFFGDLASKRVKRVKIHVFIYFYRKKILKSKFKKVAANSLSLIYFIIEMGAN